MRARYYSPEIMRFVSADPYKDGWNWYAYANGNPISYFDPFGLFASCPSGINWGLGTLLSNIFGDYWREGIDTMHSWGGSSSVFASYFEKIVGNVSGVLDFVSNPWNWLLRLNHFLENPMTNNFVVETFVGIGNFYSGIWNASLNDDWHSFAEHMGDFTVAFPMYIYGLNKTPFVGINIGKKPQVTRTPVIGRMHDLDNIRLGKNEYRVADLLSNRGNPKLNWKQNSGVLRSIMRERTPLKDISLFDSSIDPKLGIVGTANANKFLHMERYLLYARGWRYSNGYWYPP